MIGKERGKIVASSNGLHSETSLDEAIVACNAFDWRALLAANAA